VYKFKLSITNISNKIGEKFSYYINENEYTDKVPDDLSLIIGTGTSRQILSGYHLRLLTGHQGRYNES
jgi:hypothetical protein